MTDRVNVSLCTEDPNLLGLAEQAGQVSSPDAEVWMYLVYLKNWTLNLMPLIVYPKVLFHPNFSIKGLQRAGT